MKYIELVTKIFFLTAVFIGLMGAAGFTGTLLAGNNIPTEIEQELIDLELVEYQLKIVRIDESDVSRLGLSGLSLELDMEDALSFITADGLLEIAGIGGSALFQLEAYHEVEESIEVASPSLITLLEESVNLRLTEETLQIDSDLVGGRTREEEFLEIRLKPERKDEEGRVLTDLRVSSGGTSTVDTNFWSQQEKINLVGVVNWNRRTRVREYLAHGERSKMSTFALYVTHDLVDVAEERRQNIITLDGLSQLLWPEEEELQEPTANFQFISRPDLEILIVDYEQKAGFHLATAGGFQTISFGADTVVSVIYDDLRLGLRVIRGRNPGTREMEIAPVIGERVFLDPHLELSGYYYPVFFDLQQGKFEAVHAFEFEVAVKYQPVSARLRYRSDLGASELRALLGYSVSNAVTLIAGAEGSTEGVDQYLAGIRLSF